MKPGAQSTGEEVRLFEELKNRNEVLEKNLEEKIAELDIKSKELEVEASLERTRAQSMLMQHSSELDNVLQVFHEQVILLGIDSAFSFLWLPDEKKDRHIFWAAWAEEVSNDLLNKDSIAFRSKAIDYPLDRNEPATAQCLIDWKEREPVVSYHVPPAGVETYFSAWQELFAGVEQLKPEYFSDGLYYVEAFMKHGCFGVMVRRELPDEEKKILYRFAIEFERAYTRFLDLKNAEAQTREAQIEAALERVRSRAMAMQNTDELLDAADLVGKELSGLGINSMNVSYAFMDEKEQKASYYSVNPLDGKILPFAFAFPHTETEVMLTILASWKRQDPFIVLELDETSTLKHQTWAGGYIKYIFDLKGIPFSMEEFLKISPKKAVIYTFNFTNGYLFAIGDARFTAAQEDIVLRVTKVFDMTYRRFLDLQKAEAQAKEAQVEAALERVRSRSMGMQKSEELKEVIQVVYEQFVRLDIHIEHTGFVMDFKPMGDWNFWIADHNGTPAEIKVPYFDSVWGNSFNDAKQKGQDFFATQLNFEEKNNFYSRLLSFIPGLPEETRQFYFSCAGLAVSTVLLENVALYIENFSGIAYSAEENAILMRFGKVFEQTYTRFLDLKKAEAQARESQIEAALERVRSRTMAMQKSTELADVAGLIFTQIKEMGINTWTTGFNVWSDDNNSYQDYITSPSGGFIEPYIVDTTSAEALMEIAEARKSGKDFVVLYAGGEKIEKLYRALTASAHLQFEKMLKDGVRFPSEQYEHFVFGGKVSLMLITYDPVPEAHDIFRRFGKVFEQTYTRFLDLKTAEAQTRESQIQLAMERVRARTMAMQHSNELPQAANLLFQQVQSLGMPTWSAGYCLWENSKDTATFYMSSEGEIQIPFSMPLTEEPALMHMREGSESASLFYVDELEGEVCSSHYAYMRTLPGINEILDALIDSGFPLPTYQINHMAYFSQGFLLFITYEPVPEAHDIFKRFAKVFEQTYTRFLDLERAEAQGLEAIKRASVDRVRAEIASMRTTADLEKITPLIWNELTTLGVPFIRCGVFIMDEEEQRVNTYLSNPEGKAIAAFHQPYDSPGDIADVVKSWHKKEMYTRHWDEAMFAEVTKNLLQQGGITSGEKYLTENHPTDLYLHFLPFLQGMLYVGNISPLKETELQLVQNLADAFSTAYARYEDFNKLEAAKEQVDKTLTDLKQAQAQLVQAEKMASLGELTAGIAHEIQNPLNFVNNFSEVNAELSDEILQAAISGNLEEIKILAADIKSNQEKIRDHGKRADSIVKGMLQHSRTTTGEKLPTDINLLADEYLRLAYHGLRAKDKAFNATLETDFDQGLPKVNIIPQDIGRVMLNLISNAFYAVDEKKKSGIGNFEPAVSVKTKIVNDSVDVMVTDNGNGIPQRVMDKIFQPFFTTKPTGQGTGLGLSLAYDIVKAHGGEIRVETKEGEGTSFTINIPIN